LAVGPREIFSDEIAAQPHSIEDLRAAIRLVGGDAHLGHHLEDALVGGLDVALDRLLDRHLFIELGHHRLDGLKGEIRVDCFGAITCERAELMHLVRLSGLDHETDRGPEPTADQMMMYGRCREQRRNRDAVGSGRPVRQDDDVLAGANRLLGAFAELVQSLAHAGNAIVRAIGDIERHGAELVVGDVADASNALEIVVGQNGMHCL